MDMRRRVAFVLDTIPMMRGVLDLMVDMNSWKMKIEKTEETVRTYRYL